MPSSETWEETVKGEQFTIRAAKNRPFKDDDGHPYEIIIQRYPDESIGTSIHDLEEDVCDHWKLPDYIRQAEERWGLRPIITSIQVEAADRDRLRAFGYPLSKALKAVLDIAESKR
jgi:hypothetical protein